MEVTDVCFQSPGKVISECQRATGHIRRALSVSNRRLHLFRTAFGATPDAVHGEASQKHTKQSSERRMLLTADLQRRHAIAILSAAVPALSLPLPAAGEGSILEACHAAFV